MSWGEGLAAWPRSKSSLTATRSQPCEISSSKPAPPATRASPGSVTTATTGRLLFNDRASLSMLITVVPEDKLPSLVTGFGACSSGRSDAGHYKAPAVVDEHNDLPVDGHPRHGRTPAKRYSTR
jgi:hypothetical protein